MDGISEIGISQDELTFDQKDSPLEKPESSRPFLDSLKEKIKNSLPSEAALNLDIIGRLNVLARNPKTYELMIKGIELGIFVGIVTGVFEDYSTQQFLNNTVSIAKNLSGMVDTSPNVSPHTKIAVEALNILGAPSIIGDLAKVLEIAPDMELSDKVLGAKEQTIQAAQKAKDVYTGIISRATLEMNDFKINSKQILDAMKAFGVQGQSNIVVAV